MNDKNKTSFSTQSVNSQRVNSSLKGFIYFVLGVVFIGFGTWVINGVFEKNPIYDFRWMRYWLPGFFFLRPILFFLLPIITVLLFWKRNRPFALGALSFSL